VLKARARERTIGYCDINCSHHCPFPEGNNSMGDIEEAVRRSDRMSWYVQFLR
jgi:hypothetical protein